MHCTDLQKMKGACILRHTHGHKEARTAAKEKRFDIRDVRRKQLRMNVGLHGGVSVK